MKYILTITNPDLSFEVTSEITSESYELLIHQVMKGDKGDDATQHPYISLERLRPYLYRITFDSLPEDNVNDGIVSGGCSAYVQNGKLYRNLDFRYDNAASFIVRCKDFEGMSFITGLDDGNITDELASQLPYCVVDGCNNHGIMVSTHVLFNDWFWGGTGRKDIPLTRLPFLILSRVRSMATILTDLEGVLDNLSLPPVLSQSGYLIQVLVTDGTTTYAVLPPMASNQPFVISDITSNPKMSNFRWVSDEIVDRRNLQVHPTGVERWNMMPCPLAELQFTRAYQSPTRLSEFIGIRNTTKDSTDEQLFAIYEDARQAYLTRVRNGATWQTMHSVVYGDKMESLYIQENWNDNCVGSGAGDYSELTGKPTLNGHTIEGNMSSEDLGIATRTSELENDSDFVSDENYVHTDNNYTDEDKAKVAEAIQPENVATANTAGIVKPDGSTITVDEDGTLHSVGGGGTGDHTQLTNRDAANQHPIGAITGLQDALNGKQPSGDYATTQELDDLADIVDGIEDKIPEQASAANKLADKAFVNSSIATNTAYFRGTYDVVNDLHLTFDATEAQVAAALASIITEVTNNDYVFVVFVDTIAEMPTRYDRYKYGTQDNEWQYEYTLNNSSFTANEWAAIQSGITSGLVAKLNALPTADALAAALLSKYEKPSSGIPESDLSSGVQTKLNAKEVFVAEYGVTTYAEIMAAYNEGKVVICFYDGLVYYLHSLIGRLLPQLISVLGNSVYSLIIDGNNGWQVLNYNLEERDFKVSSWQSTPDNNHYPSEKLVKDSLDALDSRLDALEADYAIALTLL